jgi:phage terminase Nu1 subunit (DNA packaging protein)
MKENPNPLPRQANPELVMHERKRKIEAQLYMIGKRLAAEGKSKEETESLLALERARLTQEMNNKQASVSDKD